jgi:hypothetical protein
MSVDEVLRQAQMNGRDVLKPPMIAVVDASVAAKWLFLPM